jgi:hypothetical protein
MKKNIKIDILYFLLMTLAIKIIFGNSLITNLSFTFHSGFLPEAHIFPNGI